MFRVRCCLVTAMALVLTASAATAAESQSRGSSGRGSGMMRGSFLGLLGAETVQKELKLNEDQIGKVKGIGEELRAEMGKQFAGIREIEDRDKRRAKMVELSKQFDEKARGQVGEVLSGEQMIRLYQIRLQVRGAVYGMNHPWIANRLKLTDQQKTKAAELEKTTREKVSEVYRGLRDLSEQERREKYAELRESSRKIRSEADKQALGLLTAEQKEAFAKLEGEKFEM